METTLPKIAINAPSLLANRVNNYARFYRPGFHGLFLCILFSIPYIAIPENLDSLYKDGIKNRLLFGVLLLVPVYLVNVFYLVPRFLKTGRYRTYSISIIACTLALKFIFDYVDVIFPLTIKNAPGAIIVPLLMMLAIGTSFEMILNWEAHRREREYKEQEKILLKNEKTILELSFLKSQVNPHFLFNTLNNIHSLAELQSEKTGNAILLLSDLLRYMLYSTNNGQVALHKEIECIENYMAIQRLRIANKEEVNVQFKVRGTPGGYLIEPLILLPFVENAFKHGISYQQPSVVLIVLQIEKKVLYLRVYNTKKPEVPASDLKQENTSGIGLINIQRRLDLLYPDKHELIIRNEADAFETQLTLQLS